MRIIKENSKKVSLKDFFYLVGPMFKMAKGVLSSLA
jgi:hypothetical protein